MSTDDILAISRDHGWVFVAIIFFGKELLTFLKGERREEKEERKLILAALSDVNIKVAEIGIHIEYLRNDRQTIIANKGSIQVAGSKAEH